MVKPIKHYTDLFVNINYINAWEVTTGSGDLGAL